MPEVTATEAARHLSDLLDAVEHEGEAFTIVRRGKAVALIQPVLQANGAKVKAALALHPPDSRWIEEIRAVRDLLDFDE
ncbi:MAG: type II toxin-antitoxin system Phd/YefM family antitoxin [Acidimicrobiia bacterium]